MWTVQLAMPLEVPRRILELKESWDVDTLIGMVWPPGVAQGFLFLEDQEIMGYALLIQSSLYRQVIVDTLILLPEARTSGNLRRVYSWLYDVAVAWATRLGYSKVRSTTKHPRAMKRVLEGRKVNIPETILEVELE